MSINIHPRVAGLRAWATGSTCDMAAVDLLATFNHGHLVNGPWIRRDGSNGFWFDPEVAAAESGYLSGGERRVLAVATSLVSSGQPVDLGDVMTGLDLDAFPLVIQALGQAFGLETKFNDDDEEK